MAGKSHVSHPSYAHVSVPYLCMLFFICWLFLISYPDLPRPREKQSEIWVRDKAVPSPLLLPPPYPAPPPREGSHMKVAKMLVVSFRAVNFVFWSHLGCSEQNAIIISRKGLF